MKFGRNLILAGTMLFFATMCIVGVLLITPQFIEGVNPAKALVDIILNVMTCIILYFVGIGTIVTTLIHSLDRLAAVPNPESLYSWHVWFAWRPVNTLNGDRIWWQQIYRRSNIGGLYVSHGEHSFEYGSIFDVIATEN